MDNIIEEIKTHFATGVNGMRKISALPQEFRAYTYRNTGVYGLAIEYSSDKEINEAANEVLYSTQSLLLESESKKFLLLTCLDEEYRNQFAELSYSFVNPGTKGANRNALLADPIAWWNHWIGLLGDKKSRKSSYDVLAELLALDYLYQDDKSIRWAASEAGTHDIESNNKSFEIKSTTKKSESHITISSRFQLESSNKLELFFFRVECSLSGYSINDVVESLCIHGYDRDLLESQLTEKGFIKGRSTRSIKYALLEVRRYIVDDNFPKIIEKSFKNDVFPQNIIKILYTIDLEGIPYHSVYFEKTANGSITGRMSEGFNNSVPDDMGNEDVDIPTYLEYHPNCVPLYSIKAACGKFLYNEDADILGWVDSKKFNLPSGDNYFIVQAKGHSMESMIEDGDYCLFEYGTAFFEGNIILVEIPSKDDDYGGSFTIKKYTREKGKIDGVEQHTSISLEPLNKDYEPMTFDIDSGEDLKMVGVFKKVLRH